MFRKKISAKKRQTSHPVETPKSYRRGIIQFLKLFKDDKWVVSFAVLSNIISSICYIGIPYLSAVAIDEIVIIISAPRQNSVFDQIRESIQTPVMMIVILAGLTFFLNLYQEKVMASVGEKIALNLREKLTAKLNKLPLSFYDSVKIGELLTKATADVDKVAEVVLTGFNQLIYSMIAIVAGFIILFLINPAMTIVVLLIIFLCMYVTKQIARYNQRLYTRNMTALAALGGKVEECFSGDLEIKIFNRQEKMIEQVDDLIEQQYQAHQRFQFFNFSIYPTIRVINHLGFIICAVWGSYLAVAGLLSIGLLHAFLQYVVQISEPITQSAYLINSFQIGLAAVERIYEVLDKDEESDFIGESPLLENPKGEIQFENVTFGYQTNQPVLKGITFKAHAKQRIAVVGATGSGKTTLVNLLMRFYDVDSGKITFDGKDIQGISKNELRRHMGMVLQDTWLFEGTVIDNLRFGVPEASQEMVEDVAKVAQCHDFILKLPQGYQTVISSDSAIISAGQQQLLTIARAMLTNPTVMILDEATSSVDTETERKIQVALTHLLSNRTSFIIAHRLSTIKEADVIMVLEQGKLLESGNHEQLLRKKGRYYTLVNSQG